jgi:putative aminopeptidase FrvX
MDLNKFKELLSVPTKTYKESKMVEYLINTIGDMEGVDLTSDKYNNIYVTKGVLDEGEFYPMFISHTDTVHELIDLIDVKEEYLVRPYTFGKDFGNEQTLCLKAYDKDGNPTGIGGDDKCGIYICMELLQKLDKVKVALFVSEETGCHGSKMVDQDFLKDVGYCVQYDAPGDHLISYSCMGTVLFNQDGEFFKTALRSITGSFGNEMLVQSHPYTDIMMIKQKSDVSCINMSCGYYNMHTKNEFVCLDDVERAITAGLNLVKDLGLQKYEFKYELTKPVNYQNQVFNTDQDEEDLFYDVVHHLESINVLEENNGIIIADPYDGNEFYIDDEDGYELYKILRDRYS